MWTLFEPVHAVTYFAPQARAAFEQAGLRGFWRGYFAGRAAPLGPVSAAVVGASFFNFAPGMVARAIPGVWALISPEEALRARVTGACQALGGLLAGQEAAAEAAAAAVAGGRGTGLRGPGAGRGQRCAGRRRRRLGRLDGPGGLDGLDGPNSPGGLEGPGGLDVLARLWQAATVLREHRGDGHWAALAAADIDGCEAVVLRCGLDLRREDLQPIRGWTDEEWDAARDRLAGRGWMSPDGTLTSAGREAHAAVEAATDRAAARAWARLGAEATGELAAALLPLARACGNVVPYPSPIGVPAPGSAG